MTDRELLELAAKAWNDGFSALNEVRRTGNHWWQMKRGQTDAGWNPLDADGDALRLAVKLNLIVGPYGTYASVGETYDKPKLAAAGQEFVCWHHETSNDPCAATRRAIVRAAAEIGKSMS